MRGLRTPDSNAASSGKQARDLAAEARRAYGSRRALAYRQYDEAPMESGGSKNHWCTLLRDLSRSFDRKIDVLDVGCGTGRYFRCLCNVRRLVGVDISEHMLEQARNPAGKA